MARLIKMLLRTMPALLPVRHSSAAVFGDLIIDGTFTRRVRTGPAHSRVRRLCTHTADQQY